MDLLKDRVTLYLSHTGTTREELARQLGMSTVSLRSKLNGSTEFSLSEAERLSGILGCTVDELKQEFTCR